MNNLTPCKSSLFFFFFHFSEFHSTSLSYYELETMTFFHGSNEGQLVCDTLKQQSFPVSL